MKTCLGVGDLALMFKVTAELNRSNLNQIELVCKLYGGETSGFPENNTIFHI